MQLPASGGGGDRTISFYNLNTRESLTVTYVKNGRHVPSAMKKIDRILRDWRRDEAVRMDPDLIDLVYDVHRELGSKKPITVISGYRSPATNNKLRSRSSGVATKSQHMNGKAIDLYFPDVPVKRIRDLALKFQSGGVGYYPSSGQPFVHIDTGSVRHWPRLTRQQLAALFPDGDTLHVPSDGKPLPRKVKTGTITVAADRTRRSPRPQQVASAAPHDPSLPDTLADPSRDVISGERSTFQLASLGGSNEAEGKAEEPVRSESPSLLASLISGGSEGPDRPTGMNSAFVPPLPAPRPERLAPERLAELSVAALENPPAPAPRPSHGAAIDTSTVTASITASAYLPREAEKTPPMILASLGPLAAPGDSAREEPSASPNRGARPGLGAFAPALRYDPGRAAGQIQARGTAGRAVAQLRAPHQFRISSLALNPETGLAMSFGPGSLLGSHAAGFTGPAVLSLPLHRPAGPLHTAAILD